MPKIQDNLVVNATGGATVDVVATMCARHVIIEEDPTNGAAAGLVYTLSADGFVAQHNLESSGQLTLGNSVAEGNNAGPIQGHGPQANGVAASVYAKLVSKGAATRYRMTEVE